MVIQIITRVIVFIYLLLQSISDAKTMKVYTLPNNIALFLSIALYAFDCFSLNMQLSWGVAGVIAAIFIASYFHLYGSGDAKAMTVIYFALRYGGSTYPHPDLFIFLLAMLVSNILFLIFNKIKNKIRNEKGKKRAAYFPFLTIGYVLGFALEILIR